MIEDSSRIKEVKTGGGRGMGGRRRGRRRRRMVTFPR
jgi:hypothetical protein